MEESATISGKQIQKARKGAGLTQKQLAQAVGLAAGTIQQYELGKRQPRYETIEAMAGVLNVGIWELFNPTIAEAMKTIVDNNIDSADEAIRKRYGINGNYVVVETEDDDIGKLMQSYANLNSEGQKIAIERVEELTQIPKYQRTEPPEGLSEGSGHGDTTQTEKPSEGQKMPPDGK